MNHPIEPPGSVVRRLQEQLRATEDELAEERRRNTALAGRAADLAVRLEVAEARGNAVQIHEAQRRIAAVDVPCGELLRGQTITDAGSIDTWQEPEHA